MSEPTYEFIKGEGWVIKPTKNIITLLDGTRTAWEHRKPNEGEFFKMFYVWRTLEDCIARMGKINFQLASVWSGHYYFSSDYQYFTLERL